MTLAEPSLDPQRQRQAQEYARLMRRLSLIELAVGGALLLWLLFGGVSVKISQLLAFPQPWASALYFIILVLGYGLILAPLSYYQGFILPHRYKLSTQKWGGWLKDRAKALVLSMVLGLGMVIIVYWLLEHLPDIWWLLAGVFVLLLTLSLTWLAPTLFLSLFFKLEPVTDVELRERLMNLARKAGARVCGIFTINLSSKSTAANAALAGLGNTRRIILSDTLLEQYSAEEVEAILAHELGHHLHRDIPKLIGVQAVVCFLAFYLANISVKASLTPLAFQGIADVASFPLLVLVLAVFGLMVTPIMNAYSRHLELAADEFALGLSDNPQAFITMMTKLTEQNLTEAQPSRWVEFLFYDHPPYTKRVSLAHRYCQKDYLEGV